MKKCTRFVGLDDSKDSIDVAVASEGRQGEVRSYGTVAHTPEDVKKLVRRLGRPKDLYFVYEAGPCGYGLYRELLALGANCMVAAPSKTPRRSGDRIKTDRRDALKLARLHRAGELHPVWVPDEETEAMRDLTRAREDAKYVQTKARQRLQSFLLRHARRYPGKSHWTKMHLKWLAEQKFAQPSQQICLDEYVEAIRQASARVQRLEAQVRELVSEWSLGPVVSAMTAHRGVSLVVASTVCAELGDLTRFDPRHGAEPPGRSDHEDRQRSCPTCVGRSRLGVPSSCAPNGPLAKKTRGSTRAGPGDLVERPGASVRPAPPDDRARQAPQQSHGRDRSRTVGIPVGHGPPGKSDEPGSLNRR